MKFFKKIAKPKPMRHLTVTHLILFNGGNHIKMRYTVNECLFYLTNSGQGDKIGNRLSDKRR